jgi:hypothetical protein
LSGRARTGYAGLCVPEPIPDRVVEDYNPPRKLCFVIAPIVQWMRAIQFYSSRRSFAASVAAKLPKPATEKLRGSDSRAHDGRSELERWRANGARSRLRGLEIRFWNAARIEAGSLIRKCGPRPYLRSSSDTAVTGQHISGRCFGVGSYRLMPSTTSHLCFHTDRRADFSDDARNRLSEAGHFNRSGCVYARVRGGTWISLEGNWSTVLFKKNRFSAQSRNRHLPSEPP